MCFWNFLFAECHINWYKYVICTFQTDRINERTERLRLYLLADFEKVRWGKVMKFD
jgi:hypothetical protein